MTSSVRFARQVRSLNRLFWVMVAAAPLSCRESEPTEPPEDVQFPAVAICITPNAATLIVGEVAYLSAIAVNVANQVVPTVVEWSSSNPNVASVGRTSGNVTAVGVGSTTVTVSSEGLVATASITVLTYHPAARLTISSSAEPVLTIGGALRLTALAVDAQGHFTSAPIEWTSENPGVATIGRADGQVTAIAIGSTTLTAAAGAVRATVALQVVPQNFLMQWASSATASSQYADDSWSPAQATGAPNVASCQEEAKAWASEGPGLDWIELTYQTPVRPTEIRIYEVWAPGAIVKVEVKDLGGAYHTVHTASPQLASGCLRTLNIPITTFTEPVSAVRITMDQRATADWNEIDAVRLLGFRIN